MGFENPVGGRRIGAKRKLETATQLRQEGIALKSKKEGKPTNHWTSVVLIFVISTVLAWLVTEHHLISGPGYHPTGAGAFDDFLAGAGVLDISGDETRDYWILIALRGLFVTVATGFIPFITWLFVMITDRVKDNFYITCWGVSASVLLLGYLGWNMALPILNDLFSLIMD